MNTIPPMDSRLVAFIAITVIHSDTPSPVRAPALSERGGASRLIWLPLYRNMYIPTSHHDVRHCGRAYDHHARFRAAIALRRPRCLERNRTSGNQRLHVGLQGVPLLMPLGVLVRNEAPGLIADFEQAMRVPRGAIGLDAPGGEAQCASRQGGAKAYRSKQWCAVSSQMGHLPGSGRLSKYGTKLQGPSAESGAFDARTERVPSIPRQCGRRCLRIANWQFQWNNRGQRKFAFKPNSSGGRCHSLQTRVC
ncbi:hypothetical protein Rleg5DRAFT_0456 [Rhizobium leguminosarum bv. viciae WSM1455]|nr:hypothetical protein Rleg5DRAFT_0456 [Rhizobium leguminosarum bv. viciae WSM1455]